MQNVITTGPNVIHGAACFAGTRVPVKSLFDHLERGYNVEYFLEQFTSVAREQVPVVLEGWRCAAEAVAMAVSSVS